MNCTFKVSNRVATVMSGFTYSYTFALTKWLTQLFGDCNRFNEGETNQRKKDEQRK